MYLCFRYEQHITLIYISPYSWSVIHTSILPSVMKFTYLNKTIEVNKIMFIFSWFTIFCCIEDSLNYEVLLTVIFQVKVFNRVQSLLLYYNLTIYCKVAGVCFKLGIVVQSYRVTRSHLADWRMLQLLNNVQNETWQLDKFCWLYHG